MMNIDCKKIFFYSLLVHVAARTDIKIVDGTPKLESQMLLFTLV